MSGNLALDFAGTRKWRRTEPEELLEDPEQLRSWFAEAGKMPEGIDVDPESFRLALRLREAIYRLASTRVAEAEFDDGDVAVVNGLATGPGLNVQLTDGGLVRSGDVRAALADIARSAVAVLAEPEAPMKECGRPTCTRIYLDRSRGARRTWCGMEECGNRVKAAAYRARKRSEDGRSAVQPG